MVNHTPDYKLCYPRTWLTQPLSQDVRAVYFFHPRGMQRAVFCHDRKLPEVQIIILPCIYVRRRKRTTLTISSKSKGVGNNPPRNLETSQPFSWTGLPSGMTGFFFSRFWPPIGISKIIQSFQVSN